MFTWQAYIDDLVFSFRKYKSMAEKAMAQVEDDAFFRQPAPESNSIAQVVKHVAGNLQSRWTDFLTSDGEKPSRDRDAEFILTSEDTRAALLAAWEKAWETLLRTVAELKESDAARKVTIRGEEHTVLQALQRSLTHTIYHLGQINFLAKMFKQDGWQWITVPPGQSKTHHKPYFKHST
jgi:uncharacterized damage-inducible protein DinB